MDTTKNKNDSGIWKSEFQTEQKNDNCNHTKEDQKERQVSQNKNDNNANKNDNGTWKG